MDADDFLRKFDLKDLKFERRDDHELRKVSEGVFDRQTMLALRRLAAKGALTEFRSVVSQGKEATIFYGLKGKKEVAVKIYSVEASEFRRMEKYVQGDPRFKEVKNRRHFIYQWAQKEYKNLSRVSDVVDCPAPIEVFNNILVMEFIGKKGVAAPKLKDSEITKPLEYCERILDYIKAMYGRGLVHGDLSEYNILDDGRPVLIDFSTGVLLEHPLSGELLERDLRNVLKFFSGYGIKKDFNETLSYVKKND